MTRFFLAVASLVALVVVSSEIVAAPSRLRAAAGAGVAGAHQKKPAARKPSATERPAPSASKRESATEARSSSRGSKASRAGRTSRAKEASGTRGTSRTKEGTRTKETSRKKEGSRTKETTRTKQASRSTASPSSKTSSSATSSSTASKKSPRAARETARRSSTEARSPRAAGGTPSGTAKKKDPTPRSPQSSTSVARPAKAAPELAWPVAGRRIVERYGERTNPATGTVTLNPGIGIASSKGAEVRSAAAGTVSLVSWLPGYGTFVIVEHRNGYRTVYARLGSTSVRKGETVRPGGRIGAVAGSTLHFQVWRDSTRLDPAPMLGK